MFWAEGKTITQQGDDHTTGVGILVPGAMVSHYRIVSKIGSGGMGEVFLADDTKLNRRVALKFLPSHLASDTTLRARFTREVQAVAALNHPNIVHVYEVSEFNQRPYFAMEYVEGEPLREHMRGVKMPIDHALAYIFGLCEGLEAAHKVGIVHRDIKPANIVVAGSGRVKILDFGLAKRASDPTLTSMGSTLGTICYMSPEQVQGKDSDNRSDLFSVGIVLYEMVAGRLPFRGDYDAATLTAIVSEPHLPLSQFRPDAPEHLSKIVNRLLAKDPSGRYPNVTELLHDLATLRDELKYGDRPAAAAAPATKQETKSNRTLMFAGIGGGVVVLAVVLFLLFGRSDTPQNAVNSQSSTQSTGQNTDQSQSARTNTESQSSPATPPNPVVDRSAYLAESTATANESARLRRMRDSMETERTRLTEANLAQAAADSIARAKEAQRQQNNPPPVQNPSTAASTPPAPTRNRGADSVAVASVVAKFWDAVESGRIGDLKKSYPSISKDWENTWSKFVNFAKDLDVKSSVSKLKFDDPDAEVTNLVKMSFRDRNGQKSEDVRYTVRLTGKTINGPSLKWNETGKVAR